MIDDAAIDLALVADVVAAYVANNSVPATELPALVASVSDALQRLAQAPGEPAPSSQKPAVPIRKSVTPDYIVCLEDGRKFRTLKRTLAARYGMTPDDYRRKWGLPADYPMVAPNYAASRSEMARSNGLGRKRTQKPSAAGSKRAQGGTRR